MNNQLQNILKFATPTSFSQIGQNPICDPETKVPTLPFYTVPTTIKIPKVRLDDLKNLLETTLSGIRKIDVEKKPHFVYKVEYFPIEGLKINPYRDELYKNFSYIHFHAAGKGLEMFPHNINYNDDDYEYEFNRKRKHIEQWFQAEIRLYYTKKNNHYLLEVCKLTGDSISFYEFFYNPIKAAFCEKNLLWMQRKNYVSLLDGISPTSDPISHYLLDELVCRDVCTYNGVPPEKPPLISRR